MLWFGGDGQLWGSGRRAIGGVDVVPLQCALLWGRGDQLWRIGAIAGCRCSVLCGGVTTNFGEVDVVPLITQKLVFAMWGLCWYNLWRCLVVAAQWKYMDLGDCGC